VIKQSQEIMNFLAFTDRITDSHLNVIWSSAQLKHCSKPIMNLLMSLHKHLSVNSIKYLASLIAKLDLIQHTEQTLLLSGLLTKTIWSIAFDGCNKKNTKESTSKDSKSIGLQLKPSPPPANLHSPGNKLSKKQTLHYRNLLKEKQLKMKIFNYQKANKKALMSDKIKQLQQRQSNNSCNTDETSGENAESYHARVNNESDYLDEFSTNVSSTSSSENEAGKQTLRKKSKTIAYDAIDNYYKAGNA